MLLAQPDRQRGTERAHAPRREGLIGLDQSLELEQRLVVKYDLVDFVELDAASLKTIGQRLAWKFGVILLAGKALFLRCGHDRAIDDQRRGAVVVEGRDS